MDRKFTLWLNIIVAAFLYPSKQRKSWQPFDLWNGYFFCTTQTPTAEKKPNIYHIFGLINLGPCAYEKKSDDSCLLFPFFWLHFQTIKMKKKMLLDAY